MEQIEKEGRLSQNEQQAGPVEGAIGMRKSRRRFASDSTLRIPEARNRGIVGQCKMPRYLLKGLFPVSPSSARSGALLHSENAVSQASTSV